MNLSKQLKQLPTHEMPKDIFNEIQVNLQKRNQTKKQINKHRIVSVAAVILMSVLFLRQNNEIEQKTDVIEKLVQRTIQLEQLLASETPFNTLPGSMITERIVNMEMWLEKLDKDIKKTKDQRLLSELMAAKIDILGDLVMLQRKINQKPDYQKIKPYII